MNWKNYNKNQNLAIHGLGGYYWCLGGYNGSKIGEELGFSSWEEFIEWDCLMNDQSTYSERCNATDRIKELMENTTKELILEKIEKDFDFDFSTRHHSKMYIGVVY